MQLPRGWYQVAGVPTHTFRRHCLSSKSGVLELMFLDAGSSSMKGEQALELLTETLHRQDIHVGAPLKSGHEECAAGVMAYGVYKHIGGQREYWIIPHEEATVFAWWQMGAMATAGMERHDIHQMLKKLHFEHVDDASAEEGAAPEETASGEEPVSAEAESAAQEGEVYVIIEDVEAEVESPHYQR